MERRATIEAANRWEAMALLKAFADRGSFAIERRGRFEVSVRCEERELAERLRALQPRLGRHVGEDA